MMRRLILILWSTLATFWGATPGVAQTPGEDEFFLLMGSPPELLMLSQPSVQKELKLTVEQVQRVKEAFEKQMDGIPGLVALQREDRFKAVPDLLAQGEEATVAILQSDQAERLKQITWQVRGIQAFIVGGQGKKSAITEEQKVKFWAIRKEARHQLAELLQDVAPGQEMETKIAKHRKSVDERVMQLLTDEQRAKWGERTGEPFQAKLSLGPFGDFHAISR